ncbi:hypothetical protein Gotur_029946, partial [Gossypium turneri]
MQSRTDGSVKMDSSYAAAGGASRITMGDSLALVQEKQGNKVLIQTDSLEAIKAIQDSVLTSSRSTLIKWIHHLLKNVKDW